MIRLAPGLIASFVLLFGPHAAFAQQAAPLRIVVLSGEDSVNVIQQKTAVAPLVEVRDRNNNPVPGAMVTFAVNGGRTAAFQGGASTISIATNAAGQAVATGFTPLSAGAVNISVEAAFQGQVVTAAITQVNVMTAAEAAAAAGATGAGTSGGAAGASGGAAGGAGGGLSATTIGIIGGVAGAGALVGIEAAKNGQDADTSQVFRGPFAFDVDVFFTACRRLERYTATLEITLDGATGTARLVNAVGDVVTSTCPNGPQVGRQPGAWGMPTANVTVAGGAVSFLTQETVPTADGVSANRSFGFTGNLSGTIIEGVFTTTFQLVSGSSPLPWSGRSPVTLTKQ